jgi:hypothetical protein
MSVDGPILVLIDIVATAHIKLIVGTDRISENGGIAGRDRETN